MEYCDIEYFALETEVQRDFPASVEEIVYSGLQSSHGLRLFYSKEEKEHLLDNICQNIKIKDRNRKLCSLLIGVLLLVIALTIMFLMIFNVISLGAGQWFNYTFVLLGLVALWVLLYFISGFIFY